MPALDPDLIARLAKTVQDIYAQATADLLSQVTARLARGIDDPGWAELKLLEMAGLRSDARQVIDELERSGPPAVRKAIEEARRAGIDDAGGITGTLVPATNTRAVELLAQETVTKLQSTHLGILRQVDDVYRQVIAEVSATGVVTGSITTRQAAQRALNSWADRGITGFVDSAGRRWELGSYAEMATRTSTARAMIGGRLDVYVTDGRNFVIVSDAPQECSLCRPFEGKGLSIDGSGVGSTFGGIRIVDTVDGAQSKGLLHPNCRHDLRPIIPGLTEPMTHTADPEGDALRQEQRRLERGVRKWKQRQAVALDKTSRDAAAAKVREWRRRLDGHVKGHGLKRLRYREGLRLDGATPTPTTSGLRTLIPRDSAQGRKVTRALDAVQKVHDLPKAMRGLTFFDGSAMPTRKRGFHRRNTGTIALNTGPDVEFVAVHEIGHAIEHRLIGAGRALTDTPLGAAVDRTAEVTELRRLLALAQPDSEEHDFLTYALRPTELWSRSYTQWVALRSGNRNILRELGEMVSSRSPIASQLQWSDESFSDVAVGLDRLFHRMGLR